MIKAERTDNPTHPVTLRADCKYAELRLYVLTEAEAGCLVNELVAATTPGAPPTPPPEPFTSEQVRVMRQTIRNEVACMILGERQIP